MLDVTARRLLAPWLERVAAVLDRAGISPLALTGAGFASGIAACLTAASGRWDFALALWLTNRLLDGLDGPVARRRGATELGGFLDLVADFTVYGGFVVAVAYAVPEARLAGIVLLGTYYVSGTAFLALSSVLERRAHDGLDGEVAQDGRSLRFVGGLAEGAETVVVYSLICLLPAYAGGLAWTFAAAVAITAGQRVYIAVRILRRPRTAPVPFALAGPSAGPSFRHRPVRSPTS